MDGGGSALPVAFTKEGGGVITVLVEDDIPSKQPQQHLPRGNLMKCFVATKPRTGWTSHWSGHKTV